MSADWCRRNPVDSLCALRTPHQQRVPTIAVHKWPSCRKLRKCLDTTCRQALCDARGVCIAGLRFSSPPCEPTRPLHTFRFINAGQTSYQMVHNGGPKNRALRAQDGLSACLDHVGGHRPVWWSRCRSAYLVRHDAGLRCKTLDGLRSHGCLALAHVARPEQELPVQVAGLDRVQVHLRREHKHRWRWSAGPILWQGAAALLKPRAPVEVD